ncbi:MAG: MlaD family protein [Planctomycetota bacterium]|nr:MlaD family protein [Planctomycetota bacterium]
MNHEISTRLKWFTRLAVTGCLALVVLILPGIKSYNSPTGNGFLYIQLPHAGSLQPSSQVSFRGVPVGRVVSVSLRTSEASNIARAESLQSAHPVIHCQMDPEILPFITSDSSISLRGGSRATIDIVPGTGLSMTDGATLQIDLDPIGNLDREQLQGIHSLRRAAESMANLTDLLAGNGSLQETLRSMGDAGHSVRDTAEEMRILIRDGRSPILSSLQQAEEILLELRAHVRSIPEAAESIVQLGRKGETVLRSIDQILHENRAPLRASVENIQSTSEDLHGLASDLRRRPWRILKSPGDRESAFIALHESANRYAEGALEVRRATEQVRDLLNRRGEDREVIQFLGNAMQTLGDRLDQQAQLEESLLRHTRELAVPR